ncbi:MAG: glycosyltransferase family 1 protein [Candidatus Portnoybacteria bacterium]|nr:glycosyltransferase family 1 protein [Candidatus Portnoybacteria bacterium]
MRIGIDARFFGLKSKGLGRYTQKLIENLELIDSENEYLIFLRRENWDEFCPKSANFKKILADYRWYSLAEQIFMPFCIRKNKVDLMHFPHFNVPIFYFKPFVITIHDLILRRFPTHRASTLSLFKYWIKNFGYRLVIWSAIKKAKKIIAVSEYVKEDILKFYRVDPEKIQVVYEGAPEMTGHSSRIASLTSASDGDSTRSNRNIDDKEKYLLYVGNAYPHKNLEKLIDAFEILKKRHPDLRLFLVGEDDYFYRRLKLEKRAEGVFFYGFVPDEKLAELYQNASAYVFASLCEGFGLPPLEAMAHGLPVACSDATCLPEILGQAAIYFDANDPGGMAEKINQLLDDGLLREKLIQNGFERIKRYSWRKMSEEAITLYKAV